MKVNIKGNGKGSFLKELMHLNSFLKKFNFDLRLLTVPLILSLGAAFFDGVSFGLLIPTIKGVIERNFTFIRDSNLFEFLNHHFDVVLTARSATIFALLITVIFISAVLKNILAYFASLSVIYHVRKITTYCRKLIYERYLKFGKLYFDNHNTGHLHQILVGYAEQVSLGLRQLHQGFYAFFSLCAYFVIMIYISWKLFLFVIFAIYPMSFLMRGLIFKIRKSSSSFSQSYSDLGKKISNALNCMPLVKSYANEGKEKKWFDYASERVERCQFSIDKKQLIIAPLQETLMLTIILAMVGIMAYLIVREGSGEVAEYMVFFVLLRRMTNSLNSLSNCRAAIAGIGGAANEIESVLEDQGKPFVHFGEKTFEVLKKEIKFQNLSFAYPNRGEVLKNISFEIKQKEICAIVGPSGSGKTTLINLLMRFYDVESGMIRLDGTDIREFSAESLLPHIALVSQETYLFNAPFRLNLVYGLRREVTDNELNHVLKKARLDDLISKLPSGLNTEIGDRGVKLSGGEKQRLSIARAILKSSEILILDEATSALDTKTERLIQEALNDAMVGKTAIVIAHRLSTVTNANQIVVLENGRLVEQGCRKELLDKKGKFYQYWEAQKFF